MMIKLLPTTCVSLISIALIVAATVLGGEARVQQTSPPAAAPQANPADVASLTSIVAALYAVNSGAARKKGDWDRFRSLFVPGARLIPAATRQGGKVEAVVIDPEGYITRSAPFLEKEGFFEREIARRTDTFGHITHVFSTYESKHTAEDKTPFARGINSIQLLNDGKRWWIVTVYWDSERPDNPLPEKYLKTEGR